MAVIAVTRQRYEKSDKIIAFEAIMDAALRIRILLR